MKIFAVDIAKKLGISKATVSLALNDKPGVSPKTKQLVLDCLKEMEKEVLYNTQGLSLDSKLIQVIMVSNNVKIAYDSELDLWTEVLEVFEREAKKSGLAVSISYVNVEEDNLREIALECDRIEVAGNILFATEMPEIAFSYFRHVKKPLVVYDNYFSSAVNHSIVINNEAASDCAVNYLSDKGIKKIGYLAHQADIYNFNMRRKGFAAALEKRGLIEAPIIRLGATIETCYRKMLRVLEDGNLPQAFIMENYQVSIGAIQALSEYGISIPNQLSLVGIDQVPSYTTGACNLTCVRVSHAERAHMAMDLLLNDIHMHNRVKFTVMAEPELIIGSSV